MSKASLKQLFSKKYLLSWVAVGTTILASSPFILEGTKSTVPRQKTFEPVPILSLSNSNTVSIKNIFDGFVETKGGINEKVINKYGNFYEYFQNKEYLIMTNFYDNRRRFITDDSLVRRLRTYQPIENMVCSFEVLADLETKCVDELSGSKKRLKEVMDSFDSIKNSDLSEFEKIFLSFKEANKTTNPYEYIGPYVPLTAYIDGNGGVCRDASAAMYTLYAYYGYDVSYHFGFSYSSFQRIGHMWLQFVVDKDTFDIEPLWYDKMLVPLEKRSKDLPRKLPEELLVRKYVPQ